MHFSKLYLPFTGHRLPSFQEMKANLVAIAISTRKHTLTQPQLGQDVNNFWTLIFFDPENMISFSNNTLYRV